jgi:transcriptional regulator with XRE-family HTH domain
MSQPARQRASNDTEPVRVLGRGLRAARGVRMTLRSLRDSVGKTQVALAEESRMDQADVSRLENRLDFDECQVATLQRYIEALGGTIEVVARFGDKRITVVGVPKVVASAKPANSRLLQTGAKRRRSKR